MNIGLLAKNQGFYTLYWYTKFVDYWYKKRIWIHKGYIIGKEKIITKVSGLYSWNDNSKHEVHVYDDKGWPVKDFKAPVKVVNGKTYTELRLPEDYSAVIIRK